MAKTKHDATIPVIKTPLESVSESLLVTVDEQVQRAKMLYTELAEEGEEHSSSKQFEESVQSEIASLRRSSENLLKAQLTVSEMTDEMGARFRDVKKSTKKRLVRRSVPSNTQIDYEEERSDYFARGNNAYKLLLVLAITSFIGVIIETLWCILRNGRIESRAGLVYGPFNLVYGLGGIALTFFLYKYRNRGMWLSFLGGFLSGSAIEYLCSFVQEKAFGSTSWDYSALPLNINGRVCLLYSMFWGILGVWWIKSAYPLIAKWLLKIPNRIGKIVTIALTAFLLFDATVSAVAVFRWSRRQAGIPAQTAFFRFVDARFPDQRMKKIFPNLVFSN